MFNKILNKLDDMASGVLDIALKKQDEKIEKEYIEQFGMGLKENEGYYKTIRHSLSDEKNPEESKERAYAVASFMIMARFATYHNAIGRIQNDKDCDYRYAFRYKEKFDELRSEYKGPETGERGSAYCMSNIPRYVENSSLRCAREVFDYVEEITRTYEELQDIFKEFGLRFDFYDVLNYFYTGLDISKFGREDMRSKEFMKYMFDVSVSARKLKMELDKNVAEKRELYIGRDVIEQYKDEVPLPNIEKSGIPMMGWKLYRRKIDKYSEEYARPYETITGLKWENTKSQPLYDSGCKSVDNVYVVPFVIAEFNYNYDFYKKIWPNTFSLEDIVMPVKKDEVYGLEDWGYKNHIYYGIPTGGLEEDEYCTLRYFYENSPAGEYVSLRQLDREIREDLRSVFNDNKNEYDTFMDILRKVDPKITARDDGLNDSEYFTMKTICETNMKYRFASYLAANWSLKYTQDIRKKYPLF